MNVSVQISESLILIHLGIYVGLDLLDRYDGKSMLSTFEELSNYFPQWLHNIMFSATIHEGSSSCISSLTLIFCFCFFDSCHPNSCKMVPYCSFELNSLMISDVEYLL
jgi:hypothetical protein